MSGLNLGSVNLKPCSFCSSREWYIALPGGSAKYLTNSLGDCAQGYVRALTNGEGAEESLFTIVLSTREKYLGVAAPLST